MGRTEPLSLVIYGEAASKANSRRLVTIQGRPRFIKSPKALAWERAVILQSPVLSPMFEGELHMDIDIFYKDRRADLDESVILDALQDRLYSNDRQVTSRLSRRFVSDNPRAEITVRPRES